MIRDRNIDWLRQKRVIPYSDFNPVVSSGTNLKGIGAGAPEVAEVSTFGFAGFACTPNDDFATLDLQTPSIVDPTKEIGVRVIYTVDETPAADDAVLWIVLYDQVDDNEAMVAPATALDTTIASALDGGTTGRILRRSSRGIINANKFDFTARQGALAWSVEEQATTQYTNDKVIFLGLEIDYIPLLCASAYEDTNVFADLTVSAGV